MKVLLLSCFISVSLRSFRDFYPWSGDDLILYLTKQLLLPPENLSILYRIFFFLLCFSLLSLFFKPVFWKYACKPVSEEHNSSCVACVLSFSYICKRLPLQRFGLTFHMHISKQNASDKQPLYLPRGALWAALAPLTARICFESVFNIYCTILWLEVCKK